MPIYRKPRNWIALLPIRRSEEAFEHQQAIQELGFEAYAEEHLVGLDLFDLGQRLHPGMHHVNGLVRRPKTVGNDLVSVTLPYAGSGNPSCPYCMQGSPCAKHRRTD